MRYYHDYETMNNYTLWEDTETHWLSGILGKNTRVYLGLLYLIRGVTLILALKIQS